MFHRVSQTTHLPVEPRDRPATAINFGDILRVIGTLEPTMWRVLVSMLLIFVAIAGCSLGSLVIFLLGPPFWITTVGTTFAAPVAIVSFAVTIWIAARLMRFADWILEGSV